MLINKRNLTAIITSLVITLIALVAISANSAQAKSVEENTDVSFPGTTFCQTLPASGSSPKSVTCSGLKFGTADCGGSKAWKLQRTGRAKNSVLCGGGNQSTSLNKGQRFSWGGVTCTALSNGLRCKNKSGRGFKITSKSRSRF